MRKLVAVTKPFVETVFVPELRPVAANGNVDDILFVDGRSCHDHFVNQRFGLIEDAEEAPRGRLIVQCKTLVPFVETVSAGRVIPNLRVDHLPQLRSREDPEIVTRFGLAIRPGVECIVLQNGEADFSRIAIVHHAIVRNFDMRGREFEANL